jgi:predicted transcriptional regulator
MARFGDLEAAVMDLMWSADGPVRVRWVADEINSERHLAFNTVQTVMEKGFTGRAHCITPSRSSLPGQSG